MAVEEPAKVEQLRETADPFEDVRARNSVDYMLRSLHEQLVQLSSQADLKASIVLTVCTIVLSLSFARTDEPRTSSWVLGAGLFVSLIAAILAVLPSMRTRRPRDEQVDLLFFAHFSQLDRDRYVARMAEMMENDSSVYRTMVQNIHNQGTYLMTHKYRYLRISYVGLLAAAFAAAVTELILRLS
jgi:Family of unknown function (DUF5706)